LSAYNRIDIITYIKGVKNDTIFANMKRIRLEGIPVNIISFEDLVQSKRSSDRLRDKADADELERTNREKPSG
jgi:hypothetical protein